MCGIAGILGATDLDAAEVEVRRMIGCITHRGPDGIRVERVGNNVLAHARLSIIDLEGGWQPLHAAGSTVIGNGEIYNYLELIEEFGLKDKLSTGSDFEPLLDLYDCEWEGSLSRLRGMFGLVVEWRGVRTAAARDPFGIKPLYFLGERGRGDGFVFASEARALLPIIGKAELKPAKVEELLSLGYALGTRSIFKGVWRLLPGEVRTDVGNGMGPTGPKLLNGFQNSAHPRGSGDPVLSGSADAKTWIPASAGTSGEEETLRELDRALEDSVRVHQRSDVPYGLFLSGGIDSTAIATLMARLNERPVVAYTCGWETKDAHDERSSAERVARALSLDWHETVFTEEDFWRIAPEIAWALDDPTTDFACLPTYKLAEAAKGTLTVVLSGEGGDELFAGYGRYRRAIRPKWLGGRPAEPQIDAPFLKEGGAGALARWRQAAGDAPGLSGAQAADIATWLPNDLLLKLDRCLMAHGLEGRTPFLDREVAAFAFALPDRMKVRGRHGKWILRKWLERHCPAAEPWARKKGFTVPVASFIAPRAADLARTVPLNEGVREVCDVDAVRAVFTDPAQAHNRWPLMFYALWWSIHVAGIERGEALAQLL